MTDIPAPYDISVVMLTFNRLERCHDTVHHTAAALRDIASEILVVNNGQLAPSLPQSINGVPCRVLNMPRNLGAAARNYGWQAARGNLLLMLDDDAYIPSGLPAAMLRLLADSPQTGAVTFNVYDGKNPEACLLPTIFHGCACGLRRSVLEQIGGYPEGFTYYGEEYDVAFRLYNAGYTIAHCHDTDAVYHAREASGRDINRIIRLLIRNNAYLWYRYLPWYAARLALHDTLQRYRQVALKEGGTRGYQQGRRALPLMILRGLTRRQPLTPDAFAHIAMLPALEQACREARQRAMRSVIICGTGKFPSLWQRVIRQHGLEVAGYLDHNACWQGQRIQSVPVNHVTDALSSIPAHCGLLVGLDAIPANIKWQESIAAHDLSDRIVLMSSA